jgi:hypothetical protein
MWLDQSQGPPKRCQPSLAQFWTYCAVLELLQPESKDIMMHLEPEFPIQDGFYPGVGP